MLIDSIFPTHCIHCKDFDEASHQGRVATRSQTQFGTESKNIIFAFVLLENLSHLRESTFFLILCCLGLAEHSNLGDTLSIVDPRSCHICIQISTNLQICMKISTNLQMWRILHIVGKFFTSGYSWHLRAPASSLKISRGCNKSWRILFTIPFRYVTTAALPGQVI